MSTEGGASTVSGGGEKKSTFRLFGKKEEGDAASAAADPTVRKTKSFKRIRGLLSGESRRERKERRSKEKAATTAPATTSSSAGGTAPPESDDVATIYNVDVDERSVVTSVSSPVKAEEAKSSGDQAAPGSPDAGKKPYLLKVVLLLMDPDTRRFELLQLEFDSLKALVSDVLAQIPISVTEESLRLKSYTGITSRDGNEWSPEKLLANFCKGNDILVAVPTGVPAKECARLARPILSDDKVVSMVRNNGNCVSCNIVRSFLARLTLDHSPLSLQLLSSGIDAKAWREKKKKRKSGPKTSSRALEDDIADGAAGSASSSTKTILVIAVVVAAIVLQVFHMYISTAIKPGHIVSPGIWLTKCGLLAFLPSCENNARLEFTDRGVVTLYHQDGTPMWELQGGVCPKSDASCVPGLQVKDDNTLVVGGKTVSHVKLFDLNAELSPWPFAEQPKVQVRMGKK